jgi:hypothetical protein
MIKPITNDHPGDWHRERFAKFCLAKAAINEPTPHMGVVTYLSHDESLQERLWRAGCYLAAYSVITGEAIWGATERGPLLIHCEAGRGRSVWLATRALAELENLSRPVALARIRTVCKVDLTPALLKDLEG